MVVALMDEPRKDPVVSAVLGAAMSLSDVVSGTYARPEEGRRKAKVQTAVLKKAAKRSGGCGKNGNGCQTKRPSERDLADGYRTLCVRLCDGYYFPVSAAAEPAEFARDEAQCRSSCASPARLFIYKNRGGSPETMTDLDGKPYDALQTAFQYRVSYDPACTCKPAPWTQEAQNRHRLYAMNEAAERGDTDQETEHADLAAAVREQQIEARARTGADLVAASVATQKTVLSAQRAAIRKAQAARVSVVRTAARANEQRRADAKRTAALSDPWVKRSLRNGATYASVRRVGVVDQRGQIRMSDTRVAIRVER